MENDLKPSSKHWARRILAVVTVAAGMLLLAAPAFAGPNKWVW
jgi:hypothetical protein